MSSGSSLEPGCGWSGSTKATRCRRLLTLSITLSSWLCDFMAIALETQKKNASVVTRLELFYTKDNLDCDATKDNCLICFSHALSR